MIFPSSCLHFGPIQNHPVTVGTSQKGQADRAQELLKRIRQEEEELRKMHGEEVEILPSPMLLQEMEEAGLSLPTPVSPGLIPARRRSGLPPSVSATFTALRPRCILPALSCSVWSETTPSPRRICPGLDYRLSPFACFSGVPARRPHSCFYGGSAPLPGHNSRFASALACSNSGWAQPAHSGSCRAIHVSSGSC
ncbi:hypothetical protein CRENBAI_019550 [Crenichthys baileyi]|uniref:Uncharacterized protein n=1 Tax=Crenichthys baileyi TaxID=28760 RepID=A0AAV9QZX2_9TELE